MTYVFGGATTDDANYTSGQTWGSTGAPLFAMGWWYPTTLTAARRYCGNGNQVGMRVDTTTSEIRLVMDHTTDGEWVSSGAGITTNKWWFIAFAMIAFNTGPADDAVLWVGDLENYPREVSLSVAVSPSGNVAGNTTIAVGNQGSAGSVAWQGNIADFYSIATTNTSGAGTPFQQETNASFGVDSEDYIWKRYVLPFWRDGHPENTALRATTVVEHRQALHGGFGANFSPQLASATGAYLGAMTLNGLTWSEIGRARPRLSLPFQSQFLRR